MSWASAITWPIILFNSSLTALRNKPVQFGYETSLVVGQQIGIIRIEQQERPIYLKKDFGKLKK